MTYDEILHSDKLFLTPEDVAPVIGIKPYSLNIQARNDITKLGFPATLIGTRVRIPRMGFLYWMFFGTAPVNAEIGGKDGLPDDRTAE